MRAQVLVGVSASGKSTYAENLVSENENWIEVNRDNVRFAIVGSRDWSRWKFTKENEKRVTEMCNQQIEFAAQNGKNLVISDTNLNPKYRDQLIAKLKRLGYEIEIREFPISLEEAWKRDARRCNGVGQDVIYRQWKQWLSYVGRRQYVAPWPAPSCVIFDVDGTVAEKADRSPFDWKRVGEDKPIWHVIDMVDGFRNRGFDIIFLSGRDGCCYEETKAWLESWVGGEFKLFMRSPGDSRRDSIIKEELFWKHVGLKYDVHCVIDDRPQVIRECWIPLGLKTVCVGDPWLEF